MARSRDSRLRAADAVCVIGLGRFGSNLALELMAAGTDVLGIDGDEDTVQALDGRLTHVVQADSTKEAVLRQLGVPEFERVVVGIGSDIQASILTTSLLLRFDIPHFWAKAVSEPHGLILQQLGVKHVIYPEKDMGRRVAHLVRGSMQDYLEIEPGFSLVKTAPAVRFLGEPLKELKLMEAFGIAVVAVKSPGAEWKHANGETVLGPTDLVLVSGDTKAVESFSLLR